MIYNVYHVEKNIASFTNSAKEFLTFETFFNSFEECFCLQLHQGLFKVTHRGYLTEDANSSEYSSYAFLFHLALFTLNKELRYHCSRCSVLAISFFITETHLHKFDLFIKIFIFEFFVVSSLRHWIFIALIMRSDENDDKNLHRFLKKNFYFWPFC